MLEATIAVAYSTEMKTGRYLPGALKSLKRHATVAARIRKAIDDHAAGPGAHATNVARMAGSTASRLRVGDFRVIFEETGAELIITRIGPRGDVYD